MNRTVTAVLACALAGAAVSAALAMPGGHGRMGEGWKKAMGLSDEQEAKLKAARRALRDAATPLKDKLEDEVDKLRGLVKAEAPEKDIAASVDRVRDARKALAAEREKFLDKAAAVLTPAQRAKAVLALHHRMRAGKGFGGRRHGGGPGRGWGGEGWRHAPADDGSEDGDEDEEADEDD